MPPLMLTGENVLVLPADISHTFQETRKSAPSSLRKWLIKSPLIVLSILQVRRQLQDDLVGGCRAGG
jgi:hypothetical protein